MAATPITRAGNFSLSPDGQIVTEDGFVVAPGISVPQDAVGVSINRQGVVQAIMAGWQRAAGCRRAGAGALREPGRP